MLSETSTSEALTATRSVCACKRNQNVPAQKSPYPVEQGAPGQTTLFVLTRGEVELACWITGGKVGYMQNKTEDLRGICGVVAQACAGSCPGLSWFSRHWILGKSRLSRVRERGSRNLTFVPIPVLLLFTHVLLGCWQECHLTGWSNPTSCCSAL